METNKNLLTCETWSDDVKSAINDLLKTCGNTSENYKRTYAVFDFDNTSSIFDVGEQLAIYQLEHMAFGFEPDKIADVLKTGLSGLNKDLSDLGYGKGSYNDWIFDIEKAYTYLYNTYGPFNAEGLDDEKSAAIQQDENWIEFAAKMRAMYNLIGDNESRDISYPWLVYWYTDLTPDEVYNMAVSSHKFYRDYKSEKITWTTSDKIHSKVGVVSVSFTKGITVTENTKELWKNLVANGIDVWVCSASQLDVIRAAVDVFGLHDYITGVMAMTVECKNGRYFNSYDYEKGYASIAQKDGSWADDISATKAQTQGKGKVVAIENVCVPKYNCGPVAGFMDSTGDYNFCTEFSDLKLVVCFNRGNRKVTDGGGVIAELAMYQKNYLKYDLKKANENGDTLYVLQGRDENGLRALRNSNETVCLDEKNSKLFCDEKNQKQYEFFKENKMTTEEIINRFSIKTKAENELKFAYGFVKVFDGYHSR